MDVELAVGQAVMHKPEHLAALTTIVVGAATAAASSPTVAGGRAEPESGYTPPLYPGLPLPPVANSLPLAGRSLSRLVS